jgi:Zinc finger, ZZ type
MQHQQQKQMQQRRQQQQVIQTLSIGPLNKKYKEIFREHFDAFRDIIIHSEAVVAGGGVLAIYAGYEISDLDIYVNTENAKDLYMTLRTFGYYSNYERWGNIAPPYDDSFFRKNNILARFRLTHIASRADHQHALVNSNPADVYPQQNGLWHCNSCGRANLIGPMWHCPDPQCEYDLCQTCYLHMTNLIKIPHIDIMMIPDRIPVRQVVTNFDLSFCQVWYDGHKVETNHRKDILTKHGFLQKDYQEALFTKFNWFILSRIRKYNDRGFEVQVAYTPVLQSFFDKVDEDFELEDLDITKPIFIKVTVNHFIAGDGIVIQDNIIHFNLHEDPGPYGMNYIENINLVDEYGEGQHRILTDEEEWVAKKIYRALIYKQSFRQIPPWGQGIRVSRGDRDVLWIIDHPLDPPNMETVTEYLEEETLPFQRRNFLIDAFESIVYYNDKDAYMSIIKEWTGLDDEDFEMRESEQQYETDGPDIIRRTPQQNKKQADLHNLKNFLQGSGSIAKLENISKSTMLQFIRKFNQSARQQSSTQQLIAMLQAQKARKIQQMKAQAAKKTVQIVQTDIFGNDIVDPVLGDDGVIYDKSSLEYLFARNQQGQYLNMATSDFYRKKPIYKIVGGSVPLTKYQTKQQILKKYQTLAPYLKKQEKQKQQQKQQELQKQGQQQQQQYFYAS